MCRFFRCAYPGNGEFDESFFRKLYGIAQQIGKHLPQTERVANQSFGKIGRYMKKQINVFVSGSRSEQGFHLSEQCICLKIVQVQFQLASLDLGEIQNIVDNSEKQAGRVVNLIDVIFLPAIQFRSHQHLVHADNRVHGGADFMTHIGEEFAFGLAGGIRGFFGALQFFFHPLAFGDVLMSSGHQKRFAVFGPRRNFASVEHPYPIPILVTHTSFTLVIL